MVTDESFGSYLCSISSNINKFVSVDTELSYSSDVCTYFDLKTDFKLKIVLRTKIKMSCKLINCSLVAIFLFVTFSAVCESQYADKPLTDICLGCICEAISGCNQTKACYGEVCGLFHITYAYWKDGGNPTIFNESPESEKAFPNCVTDPQCAATTMQNYMKKFGQDCNDDRVVDCLDYFRIHKLGGYGCRGELDFNQNLKLTNCLAEYDPSRTGSGNVDIRINN